MQGYYLRKDHKFLIYIGCSSSSNNILFKTVNIYYVTVVGQSNVKMSPVEFSLNKQVVPKHVSLFHQ